ncbi:MAG: DUF6033 family protein [Clostridium sp.]|nr:DUF6033 family protein [Clostridium sp.]
MSMEIANNYNHYALNYTDNTENSDNRAIERKTNTPTNSKDKVQEYYEKLCKKFGNITFNTGGRNVSGNENRVVLNLSSKCLEKMANDSEFAKKVEFNLNGMVQGQKNMFTQAKADNAVIHGVTVIMDADGNVSVTCGGMTRTNGAKQNSTILNTDEKQKEKLDKKREKGKSLEVKTNTPTNGKDKVQEYYEKLCKKFPQINFNTNGGVWASNSSKVTVNLSYDCLKKMANDPEFAKEIEWNLSGEAAANSMVYGWAKRDGVVLGGRTVTYDADGNRQSSCGGMRTANAGNENSNVNKLQKKYETEEERYLKAKKKREEKEKIDKKRAEKKIEEEKAAERQAEKKAAEEARTEMGEYTVTGTDIKAVSQKIIAVSLSTDALAGASFDIKA